MKKSDEKKIKEKFSIKLKEKEKYLQTNPKNVNNIIIDLELTIIGQIIKLIINFAFKDQYDWRTLAFSPFKKVKPE